MSDDFKLWISSLCTLSITRIQPVLWNQVFMGLTVLGVCCALSIVWSVLAVTICGGLAVRNASDCWYADRSLFVLYFKICGDGKHLNRFVLNTRLVRNQSENKLSVLWPSGADMLTVLGTGYPRSLGSISGRGKRCVSFSEASRLALGPTHPRIEWPPEALFQRAKQPGRACRWPLSSILCRD
jgi:hypothetical protein